MPDVSASVGVLQGQAFDGHFQNVRIINDGVNKTGFEFLAGAYVTELKQCQFGRVFFNGSATTTAARRSPSPTATSEA